MSTIAFSSMHSLLSLKNQSRMKPLANKAESLSMGAHGYAFWSFVLGLSVLELLSSDNFLITRNVCELFLFNHGIPNK